MKKIFSLLIAFLPFNFLRIYLYNLLGGYNISKNSKISFGCIIIAKQIKVENSSLGIFNFIYTQKIQLENSNISNFNIIKNFSNLECVNNSLIGSYNKLIGESLENGILKMNRAQFTTSHLIHINNKFILEKDVVFGGKNSLINIGITIKPTIIKDKVYFGSSIYLSSGINIASEVLIGSGSIVRDSLNNQGLFVSHRIRKVS